MSTKTISITDEAYHRLKVRKKTKESFTDVINRLTSKRDLLDFAGIISKKYAKELEKSFKKSRALSIGRAKKVYGALNDS